MEIHTGHIGVIKNQINFVRVYIQLKNRETNEFQNKAPAKVYGCI